MKLLLVFITRVFLTIVAFGSALLAVMMFLEDLSYFRTWVTIILAIAVAVFVGWPQIKWWRKFLKED